MAIDDSSRFRQRDNGQVEHGIMRCPDGHMCDNGSVCVENALDEGQYSCDCDSIGNEKYAGLRCEHRATSYCLHSPEGRTSESFCTNNGKCIQLVSRGDDPHYGCECPAGYVGDFCQFIEGSVPKNWPTNSDGSSSYPYTAQEKNENAAIAGVIIGILAVITVATLYALVRKKTHKTAMEITAELGEDAAVQSPTSASTADGSDLVLEADGAVLQEAVKNAGAENGAGDDDGMTNEAGLEII